MPLGRTLPPAAAPVWPRDILNGFRIEFIRPSDIDNIRIELQEFFQAKHCFLVSSGKAALTLLLKSLKTLRTDRDEVLIPAFTCFSVPAAISRAGLKTRICDLDPDTLDFDFLKLREQVKSGNRILAIINVHLFGLPSNTKEIRKIAELGGHFLIEDAAQAMGSCGKEGVLGAQGDAGFFSLGRGKALSSVKGGVIITNSDQIGVKIKQEINRLPVRSWTENMNIKFSALAMSCFLMPSLFWIPKILPWLRLGETIYDPQVPIHRLSNFQLGLLKEWIYKIRISQKCRIFNASYWHSSLSRFDWISLISSTITHSKEYPLLRFPVFVRDINLKKQVLKVSEKKGFGIMPSYPGSIASIGDIVLANENRSFPVAEECARSLVTFPVHEFVNYRDRQRILESMKGISNQRDQRQ